MRNLELFKNYLNYPSPSNIYKALNETKSLEENNTHIALTNVLTNFKNKAKNMAENEIVNIVEKILDFDKKKTKRRFKNSNTKSNAQHITNFFSTIKSRK